MQKISEGIHGLLSLESIAAVSQLLALYGYFTNMLLRYINVLVSPNLSMMQSDSSSTADQPSSRRHSRYTIVHLYLHQK